VGRRPWKAARRLIQAACARIPAATASGTGSAVAGQGRRQRRRRQVRADLSLPPSRDRLAGECNENYNSVASNKPPWPNTDRIVVGVCRGSPPPFDRLPADDGASRELSGMGSLGGSGTIGP
jgi:hypothetical protein